MPKPATLSLQLTETQREVLAAAARRADGAVVMPGRLRGNAPRALAKSLLDRGLAREIRARGDLPAWRRDTETSHSFALIATRTGRAAVGATVVAAAGSPSKSAEVGEEPAASSSAGVATSAAASGEAMSSAPDAPREGSKLAGVIALLGREQGTSIDEVMSTMGWLPHTTRAALSGLRKRGYALTREVGDSGPRYRIENGPVAAA